MILELGLVYAFGKILFLYPQIFIEFCSGGAVDDIIVGRLVIDCSMHL